MFGQKQGSMSFDMKLFFAYHIAMMVMFMGGRSLTVPTELALAGGWAAILAAVSAVHKRREGWRWPGIKPLDLLWAVGTIVAIGLFLFSASPNFPPNTPGALPWYLIGGGIGLLGVLTSLKVVRRTREEFEADVEAARAPVSAPPAAALIDKPGTDWRTWIRRIYGFAFFAIWLEALAFFYMYGRGVRDGASAPTPEASWPLTDHGRTVYLTVQDGQLIGVLQTIMMFGIPGAMLLGLLIHFGLGVPLFSNLPTWGRAGRED